MAVTVSQSTTNVTVSSVGITGKSGTSGLDGTFFGSSGTSGTTGTSGTSGLGSDGTSGTSGTSGQDGTFFGSSGSSGTSGAGTSGTSGESGSSGTSGTSGQDGTFFGSSGTSATSGTSGTTGTSGITQDLTSLNTFTSSIQTEVNNLTSETGSFVQTSQTSSMAVGSATNANNLYINFSATDSLYRIPMISGAGSNHYSFKNPANEVFYYYRTTNPVSSVSQQADYITIGGGTNTAGGIFLNSTVGIPSFVYSDGPLHLYSTVYKVEINSSDHINIVGETKITGSTTINDLLKLEPTDELLSSNTEAGMIMASSSFGFTNLYLHNGDDWVVLQTGSIS